MKNYSVPSNVEHEQPQKNSSHLSHVCCLPAVTDENCGGTSWQEIYSGQFESETPCLVQRGFEVKSEPEQRVNPI